MPNGYNRGGGQNNMTANVNRQLTAQEINNSTKSKKQGERAVREAYKRERKIESYLADDENFPCFATQLSKMGLQLRDIPGDGNCLFRALGDQLEGHCRNHFRYRQDVVRYMVDHKADFAPFIEDDIPFETHIQNLKKLGIYAGNDAIVAFARHHQVNIIIHQLNAKHLMISGSTNSNSRQLHISYHNGDHYSSIRKLNDNTESPSSIRIQDYSDGDSADAGRTYLNGHIDKSAEEEDGLVRAMRGCQSIEQEVIAATDCHDLRIVRETLMDVHYDADAAIAYLLQVLDITERDKKYGGARTDTELRMYGSSDRSGQRVHFRDDSLGGSSGYGSMNSNKSGTRPKLPMQQNGRFSSRKQKESKKIEKKLRAEERHRQKVMGTVPVVVDPSVHTVLSRSSAITMI